MDIFFQPTVVVDGVHRVLPSNAVAPDSTDTKTKSVFPHGLNSFPTTSPSALQSATNSQGRMVQSLVDAQITSTRGYEQFLHPLPEPTRPITPVIPNKTLVKKPVSKVAKKHREHSKHSALMRASGIDHPMNRSAEKEDEDQFCCFCEEPYSAIDPKVLAACCASYIGFTCQVDYYAERGTCYMCEKEDEKTRVYSPVPWEEPQHIHRFLKKPILIPSASEPTVSASTLLHSRLTSLPEMAEEKSAVSSAKDSIFPIVSKLETPKNAAPSVNLEAWMKDISSLLENVPKDRNQIQEYEFFDQALSLFVDLCTKYRSYISEKKKDSIIGEILVALGGMLDPLPFFYSFLTVCRHYQRTNTFADTCWSSPQQLSRFGLRNPWDSSWDRWRLQVLHWSACRQPWPAHETRPSQTRFVRLSDHFSSFKMRRRIARCVFREVIVVTAAGLQGEQPLPSVRYYGWFSNHPTKYWWLSIHEHYSISVSWRVVPLAAAKPL